MGSGVAISLSEYLDRVYRPDCEYIDGELMTRNAGETEHSNLQMLISGYLHSRKKEWGIRVLPEQRLQVKATSFRVPDITVVLGGLPTAPILREPPFLCIEILSRDDSMADMQERIEDYLAFGVAHVWVVNPKKLRAFYCTADGMREAKDGALHTENPEITVPILQLEDL